ncbi:MAG: cytidine deaminase [Candidatus Obscuribacterales bacterium]|nr:cytidine deaminase [Candidatus Obscuribacterales bacterium]
MSQSASLDPSVCRRLIDAAKDASERAYAPHSNFFVGAALLTEDGTVFTGCNVENRVHGGSICAERTALVKAISEGHRHFQAIAVFCKAGEGWPCGVCRQFISEFGSHIIVIVESEGGNLILHPISELLPEMPAVAAL